MLCPTVDQVKRGNRPSRAGGLLARRSAAGCGRVADGFRSSSADEPVTRSKNSMAAKPRGSSPDGITTVLADVADPAVILKTGGGLYWLIPAVTASLPGGVINAWLFLIKVTN